MIRSRVTRLNVVSKSDMDSDNDDTGVNIMMWIVVVLCTIAIFAMHLDKNAEWGCDAAAMRDDEEPPLGSTPDKKVQ